MNGKTHTVICFVLLPKDCFETPWLTTCNLTASQQKAHKITVGYCVNHEESSDLKNPYTVPTHIFLQIVSKIKHQPPYCTRKTNHSVGKNNQW